MTDLPLEPALVTGQQPLGELTSASTARFRALVLHFLSPDLEVRLQSYKDGEAIFQQENPGKAPTFMVLVDGSKEEERSLRLRLARLGSERVSDQHVVFVANHGWMSEALPRIAKEFLPKVHLYQLDADGVQQSGGRSPVRVLRQALESQKRLPTSQVTEAQLIERCDKTEGDKQRLLEKYEETLQARPAPVTILLAVLSAALLGLTMLWQGQSDSLTVLVQLGARVRPFIRDGEWWRLLSASLLHTGPVQLGVNLLALLSLGVSLEKHLGSMPLLGLYTLSALAGGVLSLLIPGLLPGSTLLQVAVGSSGALCGFLGAAAVIVLAPGVVVRSQAQRLQKLALGNVVLCAVLSFLPGVDRVANLAGVVCGAALILSGVLRPLRLSDGLRDGLPRPALWSVLVGVACAVALFGSVALAIVKGQPWQPDPSWKQRLGQRIVVDTNKRAGAAGVAGNTGGAAAGGADQGDAADQVDMTLSRHVIGTTSFTIALPQALGEGTAKPGGSPGMQTLEFGDLTEKLQTLQVVVQPFAKPMTKKARLQQTFDQTVASVRAQRRQDPRLTPVGEPVLSAIDGQPVWEQAYKLPDSLSARLMVHARRRGVVVMYHVYSELLAEALQVNLQRVLKTLDDGADGPKKGRKR